MLSKRLLASQQEPPDPGLNRAPKGYVLAKLNTTSMLQGIDHQCVVFHRIQANGDARWMWALERSCHWLCWAEEKHGGVDGTETMYFKRVSTCTRRLLGTRPSVNRAGTCKTSHVSPDSGGRCSGAGPGGRQSVTIKANSGR